MKTTAIHDVQVERLVLSAAFAGKETSWHSIEDFV
ncbi:MAG: hypothetical protein DVB22_000299 [Verrucomicrobia bacterium]|jgi:hypothetical protein|nr:MAG: hypothetical protein DVB22_000299 [Verrucomicrobiota bacterium]